jgi:alginate O-acetyltransferase complex protein AlgI
LLFNSFEFILFFLPIALFGYYALNYFNLFGVSKIWVIISSLFFYAYSNINYLPLILTSVVINYFFSYLIINYENLSIKKSRISKKGYLILGILFNIAVLGYYKYHDFFIENINYFSGSDFILHNLALPLAISFFTLKQIAFIVDSYEGLVKEKSIINYTIFVTFFPQLIAGPIVHHREMMPQFNVENCKFLYGNFKLGLFIFSIGLFKKVMLADTLSIWVDNSFSNAETLSILAAWTASITYSFQLYFDFSGYTDMALGLALLFNIKLPHNFNSPFLASSIIEFWSRWHITLTNFITTYIYTPILKSSKKISFTWAMLATFFTFQVAGIWHGAEWKYILFGALHGLALVVNHIWKKFKFKLNRFIAWLVTFTFISITFTIFRAEDVNQSLIIIQRMFGLNSNILSIFQHDFLNLFYLFILSFIVFQNKNTLFFLKEKIFNNYLTVFLLLISFYHLNYFQISNDFGTKFIYFNY